MTSFSYISLSSMYLKLAYFLVISSKTCIIWASYDFGYLMQQVQNGAIFSSIRALLSFIILYNTLNKLTQINSLENGVEGCVFLNARILVQQFAILTEIYKIIILIVEMGHKDKKCCGKGCEAEEHCDQQFEGDDQEEVDIQEQVEQKIKQLPTLREKIQAIAINGYLIQKRKLDSELTKQQEEVERKFRELYKPYIEQINNIIQGKHAFSDADFQQIGELLTPQEQQTKHNYFTNQKISEFWLKVFINSDVIGENVEERDQPLLKHLQRVEAGKSEDLKKLWVDFYFSENQWFTNEKVHKEFQLDGEVIKKSSGDKIQWKEGKNITIKIVKKKNKKKGGEKKTKEVKQKSFFNFFLDIEIDSDEQDDQNDEDNQQVEDLELQYEIAQALYEDIIPKSLEYYLGLIETMDDLGELEDIEEQDQGEDDEPKKKKK